MARKKEKIKTLFITRNFPPAIGGMERFAKDLYEALKKDVDQALLSWGGSKKMLILVIPYFFIKSCWILARKDIDIIHAQDGVILLLATILGKIFRKPVVVVVHGLDVTYKNALYQYAITHALKAASEIVCNSRSTKEEVLKRGVNSRTAHVIPLGITDDLYDARESSKLPSSFEIPKDSKILLSVGRLVKRKGIAWFIRNVLPEVVSQEKDTILIICGKGPEEQSIGQAINDAALTSNVRLLGAVSNNELRYLYNNAACFVMPNIKVSGDKEGFGRVLLEASLCQLPIVASDIEGIPDAITHNKNGVLVQAESSKAHIAAILDILRDNKKAHKFGIKSRSYTLEHYNWQLVSENYVALYNSLITDRTS